MSLFTSSSNNNSLRIIVLACSGFIIYSLVLKILDPKVTVLQNQWISNYSVAEKFIYNTESPKVVIVGSSMSTRLLENKFSNNVYNLSFGGGSALTGLEIIKNCNRFPDVLFIETNIIERQINSEMLDRIFTPVIWRIKGSIISLQYSYQPINIFLSFLKNHFGRSDKEKLRIKPNEKLLNTMLMRHSENNNCADIFIDNAEIRELKRLVDYFKETGVKIVFFQIPVHKTLLYSKRYEARRKILSKIFTDAEFNWVKAGDVGKYQTADGVHLSYKSSSEFSAELNKIITTSVSSL